MSVKIDGISFCYLNDQKDLRRISKEEVPDFDDVFCGLTKHCRTDYISFTGPGIYKVEYYVNTPVSHGLDVEKVDVSYIKGLISDLEALLLT